MLTVELPCKIGDYAYAIRNYKGHIHPNRGIVSDMYFVKDMKLCVVVHGIARGEWGKTIFGTYEEAERAIAERKTVTDRHRLYLGGNHYDYQQEEIQRGS